MDKAESDIELAKKINAESLIHWKEILDVSVVFIHVSTDYVFDGKHPLPYTEDIETNPLGTYGKTKRLGEEIILERPNSLVLRTSWLYSGFGHNFVKTMIKLGKERDELNVVFDQIGTPTYARDLASSILSILEKDQAAEKNNLYHFSNEGVCSWYDFACEIMDIKEIECKINPIDSSAYPTPAPRPHYSVLNKSKIKSQFDLKIRHWKDALKEMLNEEEI